MAIYATLKKTWTLYDGSTAEKKEVEVKEGKHELERIPNPVRGAVGNWLVLKGTQTGMAEGAWKQWINGSMPDVPQNDPRSGKPIDWGEFEIILEEDGKLVPPPVK